MHADLILRWAHMHSCAECCAPAHICMYISKTCLYNFDPLKPHFYIVKLGFTGVYIIFLISAQKHRLSVLVRTASSRFRSWNIRVFLSENFQFFGGKISVHLNRRVFIMINEYSAFCVRSIFRPHLPPRQWHDDGGMQCSGCAYVIPDVRTRSC